VRRVFESGRDLRKLKQTTAAGSGWAVDNSYGGQGCGETTFDVASYVPLRVYTSFDLRSVAVPLSVRVVKDPRVAFYAEMGAGSTGFGMSQAQKAATGISLLSIGGVLVVCLCCYCLYLRASGSNKIGPSSISL